MKPRQKTLNPNIKMCLRVRGPVMKQGPHKMISIISDSEMTIKNIKKVNDNAC
jgi:hypothetical protein